MLIQRVLANQPWHVTLNFVALQQDSENMIVCYTNTQLQQEINRLAAKKEVIGFVPTMGALHEGHISLVKKAHSESDIVVVSIFVNPTQFNSQDDLKTYPRTIEKDIELLTSSNYCTILFAPSNPDEVYHDYTPIKLNLNGLDSVMEGPNRPNHFDGVVNVVNQLFKLVKPHKAFFGEKDFQQLAIIVEMTQQLKLPIQIIGCPIKREPHGLAMSSRNERLSDDHRKRAKIIYKSLTSLRKQYLQYTMETCVENAIKNINAESDFSVEYLTIVDGRTLQPISAWHETKYAQVCTVVNVGDVRLIDNIQVFKS